MLDIIRSEHFDFFVVLIVKWLYRKDSRVSPWSVEQYSLTSNAFHMGIWIHTPRLLENFKCSYDEPNCSAASISANSIPFDKFAISALPDIEVHLNAQNYGIGDTIIAKCVGSANPPIERFSWYIGSQLIDDENGPDLFLESGAQRSLNGEPLRCQAFNEVGDSTAESLLNIECKYAWERDNQPEPTSEWFITDNLEYII